MSNIISEARKGDAPNFAYWELDIVRVAGKSQLVRIFELLDFRGGLSSAKYKKSTLSQMRLKSIDCRIRMRRKSSFCGCK